MNQSDMTEAEKNEFMECFTDLVMAVQEAVDPGGDSVIKMLARNVPKDASRSSTIQFMLGVCQGVGLSHPTHYEKFGKLYTKVCACNSRHLNRVEKLGDGN